MLLTITNTTPEASDLGYLLHKHPDKVQTFNLSFGAAHVFYPEAGSTRFTAALLLDVDPIGLVRNRRGPKGEGFSLDQYVNDRPYVASSFMSVALARVFNSALGGRCRDKPGLVDRPLRLEVRLACVPARRGGEDLLRRLFEPLGYRIEAARHGLDDTRPDWGESPYFDLKLSGEVTLRDALSHLYVLLPVLDNDKHYWVGRDELEKLLSKGERWLKGHPEKQLITNRYLRYTSRLTREALSRLVDEESDPDAEAEAHDKEEETVEERISLHEQRHAAVIAALKASGARRVLDLGCAQGALLRRLMQEKQFEAIVGLDVSLRSLDAAEDRLRLDRLPAAQRERITLMHGSLMYRDRRIQGYDAAAVVEVIEHLDPPRLAALERVVFEFARPGAVVLTTPNVEYNVRFETLPAGRYRHRDHRFEWTREQFKAWAGQVCERFGYGVRFLTVGPEDPEVGGPTQMAVFEVRPDADRPGVREAP